MDIFALLKRSKQKKKQWLISKLSYGLSRLKKCNFEFHARYETPKTVIECDSLRSTQAMFWIKFSEKTADILGQMSVSH